MDILLKQLDEYVEKYKTLKGAEYIVKNFDLSYIDLLKYYNFSDNNYTRNLIIQSQNIQILLICWNCNQKSPIHNHPQQGCILKLIEGELLEERYDIKEVNKISENKIKVNDISYIDNSIAYHRIINPSYREKAVSLHIYSPIDFTPSLYDN